MLFFCVFILYCRYFSSPVCVSSCILLFFPCIYFLYDRCLYSCVCYFIYTYFIFPLISYLLSLFLFLSLSFRLILFILFIFFSLPSLFLFPYLLYNILPSFISFDSSSAPYYYVSLFYSPYHRYFYSRAFYIIFLFIYRTPARSLHHNPPVRRKQETRQFNTVLPQSSQHAVQRRTKRSTNSIQRQEVPRVYPPTA